MEKNFVESIHHINFVVGNSIISSSFFCTNFNFEPTHYQDLTTGEKKLSSRVIKQNNINLIFSSSSNPSNDEFYSHYQKHGENSIFDVAFEVVN
jgi:hypothetical protein